MCSLLDLEVSVFAVDGATVVNLVELELELGEGVVEGNITGLSRLATGQDPAILDAASLIKNMEIF